MLLDSNNYVFSIFFILYKPYLKYVDALIGPKKFLIVECIGKIIKCKIFV